MVTYANVTPTVAADGETYASSVTLTGSEVDLGTPFAVPGITAISAEVALTITGASATTSLYVVMQGSFDGTNWIDLAWLLYTTAGTQSPLFYLSAGGITNNAVQQSRASGTAPGSTGSNAGALPGQIRFMGKVTFTGGTNPAATVTVKYRSQGAR